MSKYLEKLEKYIKHAEWCMEIHNNKVARFRSMLKRVKEERDANQEVFKALLWERDLIIHMEEK